MNVDCVSSSSKKCAVMCGIIKCGIIEAMRLQIAVKQAKMRVQIY